MAQEPDGALEELRQLPSSTRSEAATASAIPTTSEHDTIPTLLSCHANTTYRYEADGSPTRPDLYEAGNDYLLVLDQYQDLIDNSPGGVVTMDSLTQFRSKRWDDQVANNPYYFNGPFSGIAVQPAGYTFIYRFMANHSAENPVGELTHDVLATWFGVSGEPGSYSVKQGYEAIPLNWYKRAVEYPYSIPYFLADLVNMGLQHPKFLSIGG